MPKNWSESDAQLLKALREQAGLELASFAKRHALSSSQLKELEDGGYGSFYSEEIKAHTGRKLLKALGFEESAQSAETFDTSVIKDPSQTIDPSVRNGEDSAVRALWPRGRRPPTVEPTVILEPPPLEQARVAQVAARVPGRVNTWPLLMVLVVATVGIVWATLQGQSRKVVEVTSTSPSAVPTIASTTVTMPNAPAIVASTEAQSAGPLPTAQRSDPTLPTVCDPAPDAPPTNYQSTSLSRPDTYVYLESVSDVQVCVIDSQNRQTVANLKAGQSLNVTGTAPFVIRTAQWNHLRTFFQGQRVQLEAGEPTHNVALQPARGA